jgi:hypothetical protein
VPRTRDSSVGIATGYGLKICGDFPLLNLVAIPKWLKVCVYSSEKCWRHLKCFGRQNTVFWYCDKSRAGQPLLLCESLGSCYGEAKLNRYLTTSTLRGCWVRPSSSCPKEHRISETGSVSTPRWKGRLALTQPSPLDRDSLTIGPVIEIRFFLRTQHWTSDRD